MYGLVRVKAVTKTCAGFAILTGVAAALSATALASERPFGLGTIATAEQVAGWDIDVRPDGKDGLEQY